jgi:hypothetical protein
MKAGIVVSLHPFAPARGRAICRGFYDAIEFEAYALGEKMSASRQGGNQSKFGFWLHEFDANDFAAKFAMLMLVDNADTSQRLISRKALRP